MMSTSAALNALDWSVIAAFFVVNFGIAIYLSKRTRASTASYFKASGALPWWLLGTSIVATTFAVDTPLAIAGSVLNGGLALNWYWWCEVSIVMAGVFFFAHLWRRANPMTDMELVDLRYSGPEARFLRGFKALYLALPWACLVMGWVNRAMVNVLKYIFPDIPRMPFIDAFVAGVIALTPVGGDLVQRAPTLGEISPRERLELCDRLQQAPPELAEIVFPRAGAASVVIASTAEEATRVRALLMEMNSTVNEYKILFFLFILVVAYTAIGGLWGVVVTDFVQFWIAMGGCLWIAIKAVEYAGGMDSVLSRMSETYGAENAQRMVSVIPRFELSSNRDILQFFLFILVSWWAKGFADGGSYMAQRLLAAKSERDAKLGYFWYGLAHFALRMWPWIVVGIVAAVLFPGIPDPVTGKIPNAEEGYIRVTLLVLKPGILGLVIATFLSAYMSTISTHLNIAASYLVNDFYRPYVRPGRDDKYYVRPAIIATILVAFFGIVSSLFITSIMDAWLIMGAMSAGIGIIYILRWYWSRISAWSEIACFALLLLLTPVTVLGARIGNAMEWGWLLTLHGMFGRYPFSLLVTIPVAVGGALLVTFLTRPTDDSKLRSFARAVQAGGPGWRRIESQIRKEDPTFVSDTPLTRRNFALWGLSTVGIYCFLIGIGKICIGDIPGAEGPVNDRMLGTVLVICGCIMVVVLVRALRVEDKPWTGAVAAGTTTGEPPPTQYP